MLDYWNEYLVKPSNLIRDYRQEYTDLLARHLAEQLPELLGEVEISLEYQRGWPQEKELGQCLRDYRGRDIKAGFTAYGVHRDNLQILADGLPVAQVLSRGQLKRLCLAMIVSALKIVREKSKHSIVLLIDDLRSELDEKAQDKIYQQLIDMDLQLFVSNIENKTPKALEGKEFKMFHVEHGIIKARKIR